MSDTPRTDAYVEFWLKDRIALWTDFARQLERELNEAIAATTKAGTTPLSQSPTTHSGDGKEGTPVYLIRRTFHEV